MSGLVYDYSDNTLCAESQKKPRKSLFLPEVPLPLIQRFGMNWCRDRSIRVGRRQANMFSIEVTPMAVKKTAPKTGAKKAKAVTKAAPKKAAPKKAAPKKVAPKKAAPKGSVKKVAPKKAAAPRLSDTQKMLLKQVADTKKVGLLATKGTAKTLGTLQAKKLIKKIGKKEGDFFRYEITKLGEKQTPAPAAPAEPAPSPTLRAPRPGLAGPAKRSARIFVPFPGS